MNKNEQMKYYIEKLKEVLEMPNQGIVGLFYDADDDELLDIETGVNSGYVIDNIIKYKGNGEFNFELFLSEAFTEGHELIDFVERYINIDYQIDHNFILSKEDAINAITEKMEGLTENV